MSTAAEQQVAYARDIWLHDYADKAYLARKSMAAGYGFDPDRDVRPFPGTTINTTYQTQRQPSGLGAIGKILGSLLLGSGLTAAGILAGKLLSPTPPAATAEDAEAGAKVSVFWGDKEIKPGESASSGTLKVEPTP